MGLQGRGMADIAIGRDGIVGLLESLQHLLFVLQAALVAGGQRGAVACLFPAESEEGRGELPRHIRERGAEETAQGIVLPSALQREGQPRETVGIGHPHGAHGCAELLLCGPDVWATPEQLRRKPDRQRTRRRNCRSRPAAQNLLPGVGAHEQAESVFRNFDAVLQIGDQRRRGGILDLGLLIDDLGCQTSLEAQFGLGDPFAPGLQRLEHDSQFVVQSNQPEIGCRHFGDEGHPHGPFVLHRGEPLGLSLAFGPAQIAPQVELPAYRGLEPELRIALGGLAGVIVGLEIGDCSKAQRGQALRFPDSIHLAQLLDTGGCGPDIPIVLERAADDGAKGAVAVKPPPLHVGERERVHSPGNDRLGEIQLRSLAVPNGRTSPEQRQESQRSDYRTYLFHLFNFAFNR